MCSGVCAETAWLGQLGEWDLEEKLEFGFLMDALEEEPRGALWLRSDSSSSPPCPGFLGRRKGKQNCLGDLT